MSKMIDRRDFIKYGVALGAAFGVSRISGAGAAVFVGGPPPGETFDVIVAGTGVAGMSAAVSAAENGAKVVLLEKQQRALAGGSSVVALGGFSLPEADTEEARQLFINDYVKKSGGRADRALIQFLAENVTRDLDWLTGMGGNLMAPEPYPPYRAVTRMAAPGSFRGMPNLLSAMHAAAKKAGVTEVYRAKVKVLLVDAKTGRVVGLRVSTPSGLIDYRAKATILATGGYCGNPKMLEQWVGPNADESVVRGAKWNTGDGIVMAEEVGAALTQMGGLDSIHVAGVSPKNPASGQPSGVLSYAVGVNKLGRRFIDESLGYVSFGKAIIEQPGGEAALVFDQAMAEAAPGRSVIDQYTHFKLDIIKANTLEELAGRIGCPTAALVETVTRFNAAVQEGKAPTAVPPKAALANKVERAPFYALYPLKPGLTQTFGGLRISPSCLVLEADGTPIRGLYAAGEVAGGFFSIDYIGGGSLSRCLVTGRTAGRNAAKEA